MLLQKLIASFGFLAVVSAAIFVKRYDLPPACNSACAIVNVTQTITAAMFYTLCKTNTQQQIIACYGCIEANTQLTSTDLAAAQAGLDSLQIACGNIGSPLPSVNVPGVTGNVSIPTTSVELTITTDTSTPTVTPAPILTPVAPSISSSVIPSTTSRSGARTTTQRDLGGAVVAMAMAFTMVMYTM